MSSDTRSETAALQQLRQQLSSLRDERMNVTKERESAGATGAVIDNLGRYLDVLDEKIERVEQDLRNEIESSGLSDTALLQLQLDSLLDERCRVTIERESPSASEGALHHLGIRLDRLDSKIADVERKLG